jgi:DNA polymerase epsilon subunit 1
VGVAFNEGTRSILGFLTNFKTKSYRDKLHDNEERMAVLCFFQSEDGELVKCLLPYRPYFYVGFAEGAEKEVQAYLESKLEKVESIEVEEKADLEEVNHLSGRRK